MIAAEHSTIGPIGTIIAQALEGAGLDAGAMFEAAGLDLESLRDPNVRMPAEALVQLLNLASERCQDPVFGLRLANYVHPTTFYSLGMAMCFSETLEDFLERYIKYFRMITTNDELHAIRQDDVYLLKVIPREGMPLIPIRIDGLAAITVSTIRVALGSNFAPEFVHLARPSPRGQEQKYEQFFGCPVTFDTPFTEIGIAAAELSTQLPSANPELVDFYEQLTRDYLLKIDRADFPGRVRKELIRLLPTGVSGKDQVAQALNISTRTLYNKLEGAGTTYREVLDGTRRELAEGYIRQDLPIFEIAYLIGFSDTANFSRAFKKWTGQSPMEYRETLQGTAGAAP
jgi:AraC-like DNA-binding protein